METVQHKVLQACNIFSNNSVYFNNDYHLQIPPFTTEDNYTEGDVYAIIKIDSTTGNSGHFHEWGGSTNYLNYNNSITETFGLNGDYSWQTTADIE